MGHDSDFAIKRVRAPGDEPAFAPVRTVNRNPQIAEFVSAVCDVNAEYEDAVSRLRASGQFKAVRGCKIVNFTS
jgi:hypothetical protein